MTEFFVVEPCSSAGGFEIKLRDRKIDLEKAEKALERDGEVVARTPVVLLARYEGCSLSVYASGRMMVKRKGRLSDKAANTMAEKIIASLEKGGAL